MFYKAQSSYALINRGVQKNKSFKIELAHCIFPLQYVTGVTKKNFRPLAAWEVFPLASYFLQRKFSKNTKENEEDDKSLFITFKTQIFALLQYETVFLRS